MERRKGKGGNVWDGATRHGKGVKGGATDKGETPLSCRRDGSPATVIVMRAWLAVAGVPPAAFVRKRSCPLCPSGNGRARRFEDWKHMTAGNGRRCRFTLVVFCIRRHFRLPKRRRKDEQDGSHRSAQAHKRSAHDDGSVTCDIVVVVGFSSLVPLLKWACAHQAGSRFQNRKNDGG